MTMTPQEHTPGPWFYSSRQGEAGSSTQFDVGLGIWARDGSCIDGQVHGCRGGEYMLVGGVCSEADARLIASAPALLEALVELVEFADRVTGRLEPEYWQIAAARAAIRQAHPTQPEGREG